jgi:hypothetical protein
MAQTSDTAKMADINDPAPDRPEMPDGLPRDHRTVAPTPRSVKDRSKTDDDGVVETARKATAEHAEAAKDTAAGHASEQAERMRDAADSFDAGSFAHAATDRLADGLGEAARSIRDTDLSHVAEDVSDFARRQPLLFFGGAALLGFAAGRMLKASERADHDRHHYASTGRRVS